MKPLSARILTGSDSRNAPLNTIPAYYIFEIKTLAAANTTSQCTNSSWIKSSWFE